MVEGLAVVATNVVASGAAETAGSADDPGATAVLTAASVAPKLADVASVASVETGALEVESLGSLLAAQPARPAAAAQLRNVRRDKEDTPTVNHADLVNPRRLRPAPELMKLHVRKLRVSCSAWRSRWTPSTDCSNG
jgi:hypothetical protein